MSDIGFGLFEKVCLSVCLSVSNNFNMALNFSTIIFTSNMHIISSVLLIKADIFYFYNFDLGGHFRGRWGHSKPEKTLILLLCQVLKRDVFSLPPPLLNLRVYIKNAYYIICSTNQGQYFLYLWLWLRRVRLGGFFGVSSFLLFGFARRLGGVRD